jgi:hypothetical protein
MLPAWKPFAPPKELIKYKEKGLPPSDVVKSHLKFKYL